MILTTKEDFEKAVLNGEEIKTKTVFYTGELEEKKIEPKFGEVNKDGFVYIGTLRDVQLWIDKFDAPKQMTYDEAQEYAEDNKCHIPTIDQLTFTYLYKDKVNDAIKAAGGEPFKDDDYYWSSSEYVSTVSWILSMGYGYRFYDRKKYGYYVRSFQLL